MHPIAMLSEFERASAVEKIGDMRFRAQIPDGWQQGRGAFGGLVLAILLRAMECDEPASRRARTLTGDLCGPVLPGEATVRVRRLRRGSNQTNLAAELDQGGEVLATASAVLSEARAVKVAPWSLEPPLALDWRGIEPAPIGPPLGPMFTQHYEYRLVGALPFSSSAEPVTRGFVREKQLLDKLDAPSLIGRLDAWWPALLAREPAPRPMATISFAAQLFCDPAALDPAEPLAYRGSVAALADGFFVELRELWRGELPVALNQQTFAILK